MPRAAAVHDSWGPCWSAAAAYDAQGGLLVEKLPGEIERHHLYDLTGELISQHYDGRVTNPDTGTRSVQSWLAWSMEVNGLFAFEGVDGGSGVAAGGRGRGLSMMGVPKQPMRKTSTCPTLPSLHPI